MWSLYRSFSKVWRNIYQTTGHWQVCRKFYKDVWRISKSFGKFAISLSVILWDQRECWTVGECSSQFSKTLASFTAR